MNFNDYKVATRQTAIYPTEHRFSYPAMGLVDELGEYLEKVIHGAPQEDLLKEEGDLWWYAARIVDDIEILTGKIYGIVIEPLELNKEDIFITEILLEATKLLGRAKKVLRGDENALDVYMDQLNYTLSLLYINHADISNLTKVLEMNIEKLLSRKERDVLKGDGDDR